MKVICLLILLVISVNAQDSLWGVPIDTVKDNSVPRAFMAMAGNTKPLGGLFQPHPNIIPEPDWKLECLRLQAIIDSLENELNIRRKY